MNFRPNISRWFKPGLIISITTLILFSGALCLQAAEKSGGHETHAEHGSEHKTHSGGHDAPADKHGSGHDTQAGEHGSGHNAHGDGHHAPPPMIYYLNWALLGFIFFIVLAYHLKVYKEGKPHHEGLTFARLLVLLVIVLYTADQFPEVLRHFEMATKQFVDGYHEAPEIGFIKFIYKMSLGVLLMMYGLLGMEHH